MRTERSYWLVNEDKEDPPLKPMTDIDEIAPYVSRCAVSQFFSKLIFQDFPGSSRIFEPNSNYCEQKELLDANMASSVPYFLQPQLATIILILLGKFSEKHFTFTLATPFPLQGNDWSEIELHYIRYYKILRENIVKRLNEISDTLRIIVQKQATSLTACF